MNVPLNVLIVEDSEDDARLLVRELKSGGYDVTFERVETAAAMDAALDRGKCELILSDYTMPHFSGAQALELWAARGLDIPFIYVSGTIGEELAVEAMKAGAKDYVMKGNLKRLVPSVARELAEVQVRRMEHQSDAAMKLSERRYRQLFTAALQGILVLNGQSGRIVDANPFLQVMLGYDLAELQGKYLWEIESFAGLADSAEAFAVFAEKPAVIHKNLSLKTRDGGTRAAELTSSAYLVDGYRIIQCHLHDITERQRAEAERNLQSAALNAAANTVVITDVQGTILWVNDAFTTLTGYPRAEAIGQNLRILKSGEHPREFYEEMWKTTLSGRVWRGQIRNIRKDGTLYDEETTITPLKDTVGRINHFIAIKSDITEKLALEKQYLRAQRLEGIGTLASGVAHDLNNILAPILMAAPLLRRELPAETRESIVATIEASAERGREVVRQVLTFARGQDGQRLRLDLTHLIKEMAGIARATFSKTITVIPRFPPDLWPLMGDPTQLHQVLLNLAVNARDAMPVGGTLTFSGENLTIDENYASMVPGAHPGDYVVLKVSDTGTGIPRDVIDRIFDPFFTTKEVGKGTGLGLSTVIGIVKSHGGVVHVQSEPGHGTTFQVFLPAVPGAEAEARAPAESAAPSGHGELVLVVDDEEAIRSVTELLLRQAGYQVLTAADGTEAMALYAGRRHEIKAVLTDSVMPHFDGLALARALKRIDPEVRIVATSGRWEDGREAAFHELGVRAFLTKPYHADKLLSTLHDALATP